MVSDRCPVLSGGTTDGPTGQTSPLLGDVRCPASGSAGEKHGDNVPDDQGAGNRV